MAIAGRNRGIVLLDDLRQAGLDKDAITRRVDSGWLVRHFAGVYSIGALDDLGRIAAALAAAGPEAMASERSAAAIDALLPYPAAVSLVIPRGGRRPRGVRISEPRRPPDWYRRHGLRLTMVPDTLLALAATATYGETLDATNQAFVLRKTSTAQLSLFLDGHAGARGASILRGIVEGPRTRSHLERLFFRLLEDARLPLPRTNVIVDGHRVDFFWPQHKLVVETDGWASHGRRQQWEADHDRDLDHFGAGVTSLRITYRQLTQQAHAVTARLGARLLA